MKVTFALFHENQEWKQWLAETFNLKNTHKCSCLVISLWAIWDNRNIYFHEGIRQTIYQIVAFVKAYFLELNYLEEALKRKKNTVITQWEPPFEDQVKVNFDATFL